MFHSVPVSLRVFVTGFPLSFDIEIQGPFKDFQLSRTLKFHFQGPILEGSLQQEQ